MQTTMKMLSGKFSTAINRIDYPVHKGNPNPYHGKPIVREWVEV